MLSLRLVTAAEPSAPILENIGGKGALDGSAVEYAALEGVAEANLRFGVSYEIAALQYCEDDSPPESIYRFFAFSIVERLATNQKFPAVE